MVQIDARLGAERIDGSFAPLVLRDSDSALRVADEDTVARLATVIDRLDDVIEAVESITVPTDYPDAGGLAVLSAIRGLLEGVLTLTGTVSVSNDVAIHGRVSLDAATLAALEQTTVTIANQITLPSTYPLPSSQVLDLKTVALDAASLAALEQITVTVTNPTPATDVSDLATEATLAAQNALLAALAARSVYPLPPAQIEALRPVQPPSRYPLPDEQVDRIARSTQFPSTFPLPTAQVDALRPKDVTLPTVYPLPSSQVDALTPKTFPSTYPLPAEQIEALKPKEGQVGLTNDQLRAQPVGVVVTGMPPAPDSDALTNAELRATPVNVAVTSVPDSNGLTNEQLRASRLPVDTGLAPLTDAQLRASRVAVDIGVAPLTNTQLRATPIDVKVTNTQQTDALTDNQLRATPVRVEVTNAPPGDGLTDAQLRAAPVAVDTGLVIPQPQTNALTNAQLRSAPVAVDTGLAIPQPQTDALTNTQLRATPVPVSGTVTVTDGSGPLSVDGTVNIGNLPATQQVAGTVALDAPSLAALESISVQNFPATQPVSGTVAVSSLPEVEVKNDNGNPLSVSGSVTVTNFPAPDELGLTNAELRAAPVAVTTDKVQGLTDTQLRATPIKVQQVSEGGVSPFVKTSTPNSDDPGLVVRQAGTVDVRSNLRVGGTDVSASNPVPVKSWLYDEDGNVFSGTNPLPVDIGSAKVSATFASFVSLLNSSQTALAANATFTGQWEDVRDYAAITAAIKTNAPSAPNGVVVEFALDAAGTQIVTNAFSTYPGGDVGAYFAFPPEARYFRVKYTNGPTAQTYLRSQVVFQFTAPTQPQQAIGAQVTDASVAGVVRSAIAGRTASGVWAGLMATDAGVLRTSIDNATLTINKANGHTVGALNAASAIATAAQNNTAGPGRTVVVHAIPDGHSSSTVQISAAAPTTQFVFEQSETGEDGTWAATNMRRNATPDVNENYSQIENNPYGTNNVQVWKGTVGGIKFFRVRCAALANADAAGVTVTIETSEGVGGTFLLGNPPSVSDYYQDGVLAAPGDTVVVKSGGMGSFAALFSGQWTGKVQIEQTIDGVTWRPTRGLTSSNGDAASFITGLGTASQVLGARGAASGTRSIRLRADTDFVGSLNGTLRAGAGSIAGFLTSAVQIGGLSQGSQSLRYAVGTSVVRLDPLPLTGRVTVEIKYHTNGAANNGLVYVGFSNALTSLNGRELSPGESWTLDVTSATQLYAVASNTNQQVQVTELA